MRTLSFLAIPMLVAACQPAPLETTEAERAQIQRDVLEVVQARFDALRTLDMEKVTQSAHPEFLTWPSEGRILNWTEYRDAYFSWAKGKESWKGGWIETNVRVLSPEVAVFSGTYVDTIRFSDGRLLHWPENAVVFLFERTPDGWKYSMGGSGSAPPQPVEEG